MKYRRFGKAKACYGEFGGCNKDHPLGSRCNARLTGRYFEVDPHQPPIEPCVKHLSYFLNYSEEVKKYNRWFAEYDERFDDGFEGQPTGTMVVFAMVALAALVALGWWIRGCSL
jgi:hypothetical protein